jgi:hypothetical protein
LVRGASENALDAAYVDGKQLGMSSQAVAKDVARASAAYAQAHASSASLAGLRNDVNDCLGDYYGRPND